MNKQSLHVGQDDQNKRLDAFLAGIYPEFSRAYFVRLIKAGKVLVDGENEKPSFKVQSGELIVFEHSEPEIQTDLLPQAIDLDIIYEDDNVIVINKQPGLSVHPGAGNYQNTLVNALLYHFPKIKTAIFEPGRLVSEIRPGIVHRLDKDTSGVMIIAKNSSALHLLSRQIQNREIAKKYLAVVYGWPRHETGHIEQRLVRDTKNRKEMTIAKEGKGRLASSDYKVIDFKETKDKSKYALVEFEIHTGRTHQIRVAAKSMGNPILGDQTYCTKDSRRLANIMHIKRQLLHSTQLKIKLPHESEFRQFEAPLPEDFKAIL